MFEVYMAVVWGLLIYAVFFGGRKTRASEKRLALDMINVELNRIEEIYEIHPDDIIEERKRLLALLGNGDSKRVDAANEELRRFTTYHKERYKRLSRRRHDSED